MRKGPDFDLDEFWLAFNYLLDCIRVDEMDRTAFRGFILKDMQRRHEAEKMDKKMRSEVGRPLKAAEKLVKKAEKNNSRLASYDEKVRDPIIDKAEKKMGKKLPKPPKGVK